MKRLLFGMTFSILFNVTTVQAEDNQIKSQEYYDKQVAESMQMMTSELQNMTEEMIKYMNAVSKTINESVPLISKNMSDVISAMKPITENMQKNAQLFADEVGKQLNSSSISTQTEIKASTDDKKEIDDAIDMELSSFKNDEIKTDEEVNHKIKLFPTSIE